MPKIARGPRGFVLLDAMVGAAIIASVMTAMLVRVSHADAQTTRQQRERTAQSLLYEAYEKQRAQGFGRLPTASGAIASEGSLTVGGGSYKRTTTLTRAGTESFGAFGARVIDIAYKEIEVTVQFPANPPADMPPAQIFTLQQRFRIYRT